MPPKLKNYNLLKFFTGFFLTTSIYAQTSITNFPASIRALHVIDSESAIFAGSNGHVGYTTDGGKSWETAVWTVTGDSINGGRGIGGVGGVGGVETFTPSFRACSVVKGQIIALGIESPGFIIRAPITSLSSYSVALRDNDPGTFWDSMVFWDENDGIMMGDPIDGCLSVYLSHDGGKSWKKVDCDDLPPTEHEEAAFAASNGNISLNGNHAWIATGGGASRVFHSKNRGASWEVYPTPLIQGGTMTGAFAISFKNSSDGIMIGGDWENPELNSGNLAFTSDGGKIWTLRSEGVGPGYRSSIIWRPNYEDECVAIGSKGIDRSVDNGFTWTHITDNPYYTGRFSPDGNSLWLAGNGEVSRVVWPETGGFKKPKTK